jgi:hypothetical protein
MGLGLGLQVTVFQGTERSADGKQLEGSQRWGADTGGEDNTAMQLMSGSLPLLHSQEIADLLSPKRHVDVEAKPHAPRATEGSTEVDGLLT